MDRGLLGEKGRGLRGGLVGEKVAITTHDEPNSVTHTALRTLIGTSLTLRALLRAPAGANSTLEETANTGAAHGMCVRNGREELEHFAAPVVSTRSRCCLSRTRHPLLPRRDALPKKAAG